MAAFYQDLCSKYPIISIEVRAPAVHAVVAAAQPAVAAAAAGAAGAAAVLCAAAAAAAERCATVPLPPLLLGLLPLLLAKACSHHVQQLFSTRHSKHTALDLTFGTAKRPPWYCRIPSTRTTGSLTPPSPRRAW